MLVRITTDGSAGPNNPGNMSIGYFIKNCEDTPIIAARKKLTKLGTCNQAEYFAVLHGLARCLSLGATEVTLFVDSQLVHHQICGIYAVKNKQLKRIYKLCQDLISKFDRFEIFWQKRDKGDAPIADALAGFKDPKHVSSMIKKKYSPEKDWSGVEDVAFNPEYYRALIQEDL